MIKVKNMSKYDVKDISLAPSGHQKIEWVRNNMPLLRGFENEFIKSRPFDGVKISLSIHMHICRIVSDDVISIETFANENFFHCTLLQLIKADQRVSLSAVLLSFPRVFAVFPRRPGTDSGQLLQVL